MAALSGPVAVAIVHALGLRAWPYELGHHFVAHAGLAAAGIALAAAFSRRRELLVVATPLALWFGIVWATAPLPADRATTRAAQGAAEQPLTLITNNVYVNNRRLDAVVTWLTTGPADIVVLQEVAPELIQRLEREDDRYPYRAVGTDPYVHDEGVTSEATAVLSRWPIIESRRLNGRTPGWQALLVRIEVANGQKPWIVAVHPPSPVFRENVPVRDRILQELAEVIPTLDGPVIVAGDFNTTPYAPVFKPFVTSAELATFSRFPATFPDSYGAAGLPIDHVMVRGAELLKLQALPSMGSDHRALAATILLPQD
jgi:endonuclease/exonuclease/phosphatase (EEP) superfamily protein YafD